MKKVNKHIFITIALSLFSIMSYTQQASKWSIDKQHASVQFSINHFFSAVDGKFKSFDGTIYFDEDQLNQSSVNFTIDVSSVNTDDVERDNHLKTKDFFYAEKYPTIMFKSSSIKKVGENKFEMYGKLTMRDVTKDIMIPFTVTGRMDNPWKKGYEIMGIKIETMLNRTEYGVGTGSWAATAIVGDEVSVSINMELDGEK